ncbi:MAG: alpha/beta hydrolase [Tardiphaga sp.]|nr:alpha/beta hydrolase [Tardiphaga sp.]
MKKVLIALAIVAAIAALLFHTRFGSTPAFRDASGGAIPGSIAEMHRFDLGGVPQSITIRGRSAKAPILIWLHGGPGTDETGMWRHYNAELEDHFLVVYWTQRGTGRSYRPGIPTGSMTLPQYVADLHQLVGFLQSRFYQQRVTLVAHSWGTNIGVAYAQAHPEDVAAYIGIGQIANSAEGERRSYAFTLAEAERRDDKDALADLRKSGPPPYGLDAIMRQRGWLDKFGGAWHKPTSMLSTMLVSGRADEMTWYDAVLFKPGVDFSLGALAPQVAQYDWIGTATHFDVPIFIVAGRFDHNTDAALAHDYFTRIKAPLKQFKWFEQSAHSPQFEEPHAFNDFMIKAVLPVARSRASI